MHVCLTSGRKRNKDKESYLLKMLTNVGSFIVIHF